METQLQLNIPRDQAGSAGMGLARAFPIIIAGYFLFQVALRVALPHSLELDEAEQVYFSQWLLAGYSAQPPFYNWLQYGVIRLLGMNLPALSVLKNVMLLASYLFYWLAARQVTNDRRIAALAGLGLLTIPQVAFEAQRDLSHTVSAIFAASLFLYALLRTLRSPSLFSFLLLGAATGAGGISKYNFVVLPVAAFAAIATDRHWRTRLFDWRILAAGLVALAIVLPHGLWLLDHFEAASNHSMRKMVGDGSGALIGILKGLGSLLVAVISFGAVTAILFGAAWRERLRDVLRARSHWTRLVGRLLALSIGVIVLMVLFAGVENVRDRWLTPLLLALPLYLALKIDAASLDLRLGFKRLTVMAAIIMVLIPTILFLRVASPRITGDYHYQNNPFGAVARQLAPLVEDKSTLIVASNGFLAGNLHFQLPSVPTVTAGLPTGVETFPEPPHERILFVWGDRNGKMPDAFPEEFQAYLQRRGLAREAPDTAILALPYVYGRPGDDFRLAYAVLDVRP